MGAMALLDIPDEELGRMEAIGMVRMLLADMPAEDQALIRMKYQPKIANPASATAKPAKPSIFCSSQAAARSCVI